MSADSLLADAAELDAADPLERWRDEFEVPDPDLAYLDGNSLGMPPRRTLERVAALMRGGWAGDLINGWQHWLEMPQRVGDLLAPLIGAAPGEVVVHDSVTVNVYQLVRAALALNHGDPVFSDRAERYEGGMIVFPCLYAMGAVIDMMLEIGPANIEKRVLELADATRDILAAAGAEVHREASPIVTGKFAEDAGQMALRLKQKGVIVSARHGRLRVSPHFYNDGSDLDRLRQAI